ncbi:MAG: Hsp70 family protein [Planctomycetes bacterium]|nr:Hsp70 family protein [Planctomycetota bacterium]
MADTPIVGIDLGTTNSLVAVVRGREPTTLPNELGEHLTPSVVATAEDGTLLVGRAARDRLAVAPEAGRAFFKRDMGTDAAWHFGGRRWTPTECSAVVLREMRRVAEAQLGEPVERAVVTVPAYFHDPQRRATIEAAQVAGLHVERILNEPTAAALAYGLARADEDRRLLVLDLGGGTFDVTLLETFEGIVEVRASGGDGRLGGEDFTDALLALATERAGLRLSATELARLRPRAEVAKRALSEATEVALELAGRTVPVARAEFEAATAHLLARMVPVVRRCLRDAGVGVADLDDVLLVGGATRMPCVVALAAAELARPPDRSLDPDRVVALGAAVQAARVARRDAVRDVVMTDVCPHSLGIEVSKTFGRRIEDGYFSPILDRNVTVPTSRVERFHAMEPGQDQIDVKVFQGESRRAQDNTLLGSFSVRGLRAPRGAPHDGEVDIRFSYDANGVLEVEATVLHSGARFTHVIESRPGALTPEQLREAVARMAPLKVRPRDLLPNRARIERASRLFVEWTGVRRAELAETLDAFEHALETGDPDRLGWATARLDALLADAYRDEGEAPRGHEPP